MIATKSLDELYQLSILNLAAQNDYSSHSSLVDPSLALNDTAASVCVVGLDMFENISKMDHGDLFVSRFGYLLCT